jgi:hypothetical protein
MVRQYNLPTDQDSLGNMKTCEMAQCRSLNRISLAAICCLLVATPFLLVYFAPIADLPQQTAQIKLFLETVGNPAKSPYTIQPYGNNTLPYLLLGMSWALFDPATAGKVSMLAIALFWVVGIHLTASACKRPAEWAVLGSMFVFNHLLYWGFYGFAMGWPAFLLWFWLLREDSTTSFSPKAALALLGSALLLYMSHVVWFIAGTAWLLIRSVIFRTRSAEVWWRLAAISPVFVLTFVWYASFLQSPMAGVPTWDAIPPFGRLSLPWIVDSVLGGLWVVDDIALGITVGWIILALWQNKGNVIDVVDRELLYAAAMFVTASLFLPDEWMNTIMFSTRWMPGAMILLVLAMPTVSWTPVARQLGPLLALALFCLITSHTWMLFEKEELAGLQEALNTLPSRSRVLGLDMVKRSKLIKGRPFLQVAAYSQIARDGSLHFSFAEWSSCLVVYRNRFQSPVNGSLDWDTWRSKVGDLEHFDYALVNGNESTHRRLRSIPLIKPVTMNGKWRLYEISDANSR